MINPANAGRSSCPRRRSYTTRWDTIKERSGTSGWTLHDLRRTFRSNMTRLRVSRDTCEVLINHAPKVLDEIYDRYDRLDEKREALELHRMP
ncbi:MAG: hypothetical protein JWL96_2279 [Sphingomonas bacterium]|uniref:hypothetical protein n=1 Tax=Sphingomonas bacterium TaxID=1895847 RepID=UPI0026298428|nr:hypothetical protein [Sphingomonas bacterium]MDB5710209.1 hypothetical protein [Sphingomonas bacterium]